MKNSIIIIVLMTVSFLFSQNNFSFNVANSNKIKVEVWNQGSLSSPGNTITDFVWNNLGYGYEFGFLVAAEVPVPEGSHPDVKYIDGEWRAHIVSDGMRLAGPEISPSAQRWGWYPVQESSQTGIEYLNTMYNLLPISNDYDLNGDNNPDSWPFSWQGIWPGKWRKDEPLGDMEIIYGMDDRLNREFEYFPFPDDSIRKGLGIEVEARVIQYASDVYEDVIFVLFDITNASPKDLNKMALGLIGDPIIGGPNDYQDDWAEYDTSSGLALMWDDNGYSNDNPEIVPGYFASFFIQTPGNSTDGVDNDKDGMIDESQFNSIDDDGDWNSEFDDLGADGLPETYDEGESDGIPTLGEPNFETRDVDECDIIGTTSFSQPLFSSFRIYDDESLWNEVLLPGTFVKTAVPGDYAFAQGSGYFSLPANSTVTFGMAFVFGDDKQDLIQNARKAKKLYYSRLGGYTSDVSPALSKIDSGSVFTNEIPVSWDNTNLPQDSEISFSIVNKNNQWYTAGSDSTHSGSLLLDVSGLESSVFYTLHSNIVSTSAHGELSTPYFTIDNSGNENVAPEIIPILTNMSVLSGDVLIKWLSGDVDGDDFEVEIIISTDILTESFHPSGNSMILSTENFPNNEYTISFKISDSFDESTENRNVSFVNQLSQLDSNLVYHKSGNATGDVIVAIMDQAQLTEDTYKIEIHQPFEDIYQYSIINQSKNDTLINHEAMEFYPFYGKIFDGLCISFKNDEFSLNENTGWKVYSNSNAAYQIYRENNYKIIYADYEIRFFESIVDTGLIGNTAPFEIWNITENKKSDFVIVEMSNSNNDTWDLDETILILEGGTTPDDIVWQVKFLKSDTTKIPQNGDIFRLLTNKPFNEDDTYLLNKQALAIKENFSNNKRFVLYQNYPNPFNNETVIKFNVTKPGQGKLEIYNILGQLVFTKNLKNIKVGEQQVVWNASNSTGTALSSGVYYYKVTVDNIKQTRKMILIK